MKIKQFKLEKYFEKYEFNVPYVLCASDCESFSIDELLHFNEEACDEFRDLKLGYTEMPGNSVLRTEISKLYKKIKPGNIIVHAGAEEAIFIFMNIALKKGDHVIILSPCYQSLIELPKSIGCEVTKWQLKEENNWELNPEFLIKNIKRNTKAVVINFPHNPTGYLPKKEVYDRIIEIVKKKNIFLFSDEVYKFLEYDESNRLTSACDLYENAVSLGVMSKSFGLAGLRIGWIATRNKNILDQVIDFKPYTTICNSAPSEFLSTVALKHKDFIFERNKNIIKDNLKILDSFFKENDAVFNWVKPKAGAIAFPSIKLKMDSEIFCSDLVKKQGVLLLPGSMYDFGKKNFRIGFGRKNLPEAMEGLNEFVHGLKKHSI